VREGRQDRAVGRKNLDGLVDDGVDFAAAH
jgi:hypothetical protein